TKLRHGRADDATYANRAPSRRRVQRDGWAIRACLLVFLPGERVRSHEQQHRPSDKGHQTKRRNEFHVEPERRRGLAGELIANGSNDHSYAVKTKYCTNDPP